MMAIPENWKSIGTNLTLARLEAFLKALEEKKVRWVPGSTSVFAQSAGCEFYFQGARYGVDEFTEEITSVSLLSARPFFIRKLIAELEVELSVVVKKRDYDQAKAINEKIKDLTRLLKA